MTEYTIEAKETIGGFVQRAGKTFLVIRTSDVYGNPTKLKITTNDVARFFAAKQLGCSVRSLAGHFGDWRPICDLADIAFGWFRQVNVEGMRRASKKVGLSPNF